MFKKLAVIFLAFMCGCGLAGCGEQSSTADNNEQATQEAKDENMDTQTNNTASEQTTVDNTGKTVKVNYIGTLDDGSQFDSSYDRGEPLEFTVGGGQMISGFDEAVKDMQVGETKTVHLTPDQAYGEHKDSLVMTVDQSNIPNGDTLKVGDTVQMQTSSGSITQATVTAINNGKVTLDANSKMAGKNLTFEITLEEVE